MLPHVPWRVLLSVALGICALAVVGCAGLALPRIDPSGERVFLWPRDQVTAAAAASANLQAAPVFTDPVFPQPGLPVPAPVGTGAAQPGSGLVPPLPQDRLSVSPDRVLAPVGSEVILKAGLCTRDNFLLTDSRIEWLIAPRHGGRVRFTGRARLEQKSMVAVEQAEEDRQPICHRVHRQGTATDHTRHR